MCRILLIRSEEPFDIAEQLGAFSEMCRTSKEFQGHGWGFAARQGADWQIHKSINPIWEDGQAGFSDGFGRTKLLVVHARSAFRNEGIVVENNMPFTDGQNIFVFNGELHGVRVRAEGRIGAEKIFNFIRRFDKGNMASAVQKGTRIIRDRSDYVRGMNILMTDGERIHLSSHFGEDPDYFTMYRKQSGNTVAFCSQPLGDDWQALQNNTQLVA